MQLTNGFLRKSPSGKWVGVLKYRDPAGQWRQVTKTLSRDRATAEAMLAGWRGEMAGCWGPGSARGLAGATVEEAVRSVLASQAARGRIERSTHDVQLAYCERDLFPALGKVPVSALAPLDVQAWLDATCARTSPASAAIPLNALSKALDAAVRAGQVAESPVARVERPPRARPRRSYLPRESVERLEHALAADWGPGHPYACAAQLALRAGLRAGECCALRWRDVAPECAAVSVTASIGRSSQGCYVKEPKCAASVREVPATSALARALEARRAACGAQGHAPEGGWFVCGEEGRYSSPHNLSQAFANLCRRAGVRDSDGRRATFHALRHTFATEAVRLGVDVRTLADLMGHARVDVTLNVYAASGRDARLAAAERLERAFGG